MAMCRRRLWDTADARVQKRSGDDDAPNEPGMIVRKICSKIYKRRAREGEKCVRL